MAGLIHTVGGTDNLVSFQSAARVPIESLKCHFAPIQDGEGDPSPENVRPIKGWNEVEQFYSSKNIGHIIGYSAGSAYNNNYKTSGGYGNTISTIKPENLITITQTQWPNTSNIKSFQNGYFCIVFDNLHLNEYYDFSCKITNITNNPLGASLSNFHIAGPSATRLIPPSIVKDDIIIFKNLIFEQDSRYPNYQAINFYYCGMSFTISDIMITPANTNDGIYESYPQKRLVNWNQWLKPLTAENWQSYNSNYIDVTFENGIATSTWKTNNSGYSSSVRSTVGTLQKNKEVWYISYMVKSSMSGGSWGAEYNGGLQETAINNLEADKWQQCSRSNLYWRGNRNYVYISYYRAGIDEHIGMVAQVKAPLLINLTQMFGPGNEPTKEEFEEQCALNGIDLTSALPYDEGSVKEWKTNGDLLKNHITFPVLGKNKFNINSTYAEPSNISSSTLTQRIFDPYTYCLGITASNNYLPDRVTDYSISDGTISFTSTNTSYGVNFFIPLLYGTYRISYTGENIKTRIICYDESGKQVYDHTSIDGSGVFSVGREVAITGIIFLPETANIIATASNIQIEEGIAATAYEEFNPNHTVYGGYVDFAKRELVATKLYAKFPLSYFVKTEYTDRDGYVMREFDLGHRIIRNSNLKSNIAKYQWNMPHEGSVTKFFAYSLTDNDTSSIYLSLPKDTDENLEFEMVADLETPISYPLTKTYLTAFLGQNNFWSNTNGTTDVSYAIHDTAPIRAAKKRIAAVVPHIEEKSGRIATFNTDLSAPIKECKVYFAPEQDLHGYDHPWAGGTGKNLVNVSVNNRLGNANFMSHVTVTETGFDLDNTAVDGGYLVAVKPNTIYTYSYTSTYNGNSMHGRVYKISDPTRFSNYTLIVNETRWKGSYTFTTDEETNWIVVGVYAYGEGLNSSLTNMQLEEGSVATSYEPYENICPIDGFNNIKITRCGKNLVDPETIKLKTYVCTSGTSGRIVGYEYSTNGESCTDYIPVNAGDIYTQHFTYAPWSANGTVFYTDINIDSAIQGLRYEYDIKKSPYTFTVPNGTKYLRFDTITVDEEKIKNVMLEKGGPTDFEFYNGSTVPINWSDSVGTVYGGYIDLINGELVQTWQQTSINSLSWSYFSSGECFRAEVPMKRVYNQLSPVISDIYKTIDSDGTISLWKNKEDFSIAEHFGTSNNQLIQSIHIKDSRYTIVADFLAGVGDRIIAYELTDPITYQLSPTVLKSLKGINNIWSSANNNIEVKYWTH